MGGGGGDLPVWGKAETGFFSYSEAVSPEILLIPGCESLTSQ